MRKEVKIGIYAIVILIAAWAGIRFLSGLDVLGRNKSYTAHYEQVNGLQDAAAVVLRGVKIGQVTGITINTQEGGVDVKLFAEVDDVLVIEVVKILSGHREITIAGSDHLRDGFTSDFDDVLCRELFKHDVSFLPVT